MRLRLLAGSSNPRLAEAVARELDVVPGKRQLETFPDGELHVRLLDSVRGQDVYVLQPTGPPVADHLLELLLLADAARRAGAARLTAVVPYFGYARQDRRATGREPVSARLVADLLSVAGFERLISLDVHTAALEGFFTMPFEHLSAVRLVAEAARPHVPPNAVVIAPDVGAARLAERYAALLQLPVAIVHKTRLSGESVAVRGITGEVRGRAPLIVDDMISTGGTIAAASAALLDAGCLPDIRVAASHALLVGQALERLAARSVRRLIVTDTLPLSGRVPPATQVVSVAGLLAEAIRRVHADRSLHDLVQMA